MIGPIAQLLTLLAATALGSESPLRASADLWAPAAFTLAQLWHSLWPIVAGAVLAYMIARRRGATHGAHSPHQSPADEPAKISPVAKLLGHCHPMLRSAEDRLRHASFSGAGLLLIILVLYWLLTIN